MIKYYCAWAENSKRQRVTEINQGYGSKGTVMYENNGCFNCDGLNQDCKEYLNNYVTKIERLNKQIKEIKLEYYGVN